MLFRSQMLAGATKQLFQVNDKGEITGTNAYVPYSTNVQDYYAGFSPMQQQSFAQAANLQVPGQYQGASDFANAAGMGGLGSAQQAYGYGNAGFQSGQLGQNLGLMAAQNAAMQGQQAQNAAYGYGNMGAQIGLQGGNIGAQAAMDAVNRANMATAMAQQSGAQGVQSGLLGQQLGIQGGQYYGGMGAGYGQQAANLAGNALGYGQAGANYGNLASQLGLQDRKSTRLNSSH